MCDREAPTCPYCEGPLALLGQLGKLIWLRCVNCGLQVSQEDE
jgi:tRNA(Ile2) C34 agmatinyltransferase TiaS